MAGFACDAQTLTRQNIADILGFENNTQAGVHPVGWTGVPVGTFSDDQVVHGGKYSARIERDASSPNSFTTLAASIPVDFTGSNIEWRGFIKTENVSDSVAVWVREDGNGSVLQFSSSQGLRVKGSTDWKQYSVSIPVVGEALKLYFGFFVAGTGKGWVDDLELLVDGKPIAQAAQRTNTVLDTDHQFDGGSHLTLTSLSAIEIQNLARLAKVWGFLKYHHRTVTGGHRHWDYDLFRVLPPILAAADVSTANQVMSDWIVGLGKVVPCIVCATLDDSDLHLFSNLDWLSDESLLGAKLSRTLQDIYANRTPADKTFFVSLAPGIGNPVFSNELSYAGQKLPDPGYQLLSLFRLWNMIQYFYPDRDVMADDPAASPAYWDNVLTESIPAITLAQDSASYQRALIQFIAKIHDTHANLWSSLAVRPPAGTWQLPVDVRFVKGRPLVLRMTSSGISDLQPGDLIEQLDGVAVDDLVGRWRPFYADSNEAARMRDISLNLTRGTCGPSAVTVQRGDQHLGLTADRVPISSLDLSASSTHDLPGDTFQMLSDDVAYLKLSSVKASQSSDYITAAAGTKGLIIDIRNYPSEFVVFTLGSLLVSEPTDFVRFTSGDVTNPGVFHWNAPLSLTPQSPHYQGKIVILVDEVTQSQAEYTTMAFRAAPGAIVIGSTTAGADGNVSAVSVPGGFSSMFSGLGVYYPDGRPTQRVGIIPDIEVNPTIEGIRAGRDELIEEAIRQIHAASAPAVKRAKSERLKTAARPGTGARR